MTPPARPLAIVFVCTGNRARSPLAAELLRHRVGSIPVAVSSAGTLDVGSLPPLPDAVESGRRLGVDISEHRSRPLDRVDLSQADLVLGFEPSHVSAAIIRGRADPRRTFLLGDLVALLRETSREADERVGVRARLSGAVARRTPAPTEGASRVIEDPLGRGATVMDRTALEIDDLVRRLVSELFGDEADSGLASSGAAR